MSNEVTVFEFEDARVRGLTRKGEPRAVLADLCRSLSVGNPADVARRLDEDEKGIDTIETPGGPQRVIEEKQAATIKGQRDAIDAPDMTTCFSPLKKRGSTTRTTATGWWRTRRA